MGEAITVDVEAPTELETAVSEREDVVMTHRADDDESVVVVDFGRGVRASVDVVGDTAIVVAGDDQYEFEVTADVTAITTNRGMLELRRTGGD